MILSAEQKCLLWLSSAEVTPGHLQKLLETFQTPEEIWAAFDAHGNTMFRPGTYSALKRLHTPAALDDLCDKLDRKNVNLLFQSDNAYPEMLKSIQDPPYLLYYAGRLSCLEKLMVALVGTRRASSYGQEMAAMLSKGLCDAGVCVVSGLARGIDYAAHRSALEAGGCTVGVLGSGINVPYPPEHTPLLRKIAGGIGLVISEYPLDAGPVAFHFPHRNRIISGLSMGVVFVEGRIKSGGMHTVQAALMQGREVFAVPGKVGTIGAEGPHAILREGARIVTSAKDLLDDLGIQTKPKEQKVQKIILSALQKQIVSELRKEALTPQEISERTNISPGDMMTELGTLEILGAVVREPGNRFHLPIMAIE